MNQPAKFRRARIAYAATALAILVGATAVACGDDDDDVDVIVTPGVTTGTWRATLSAANEVPTNNSVGTGVATIVRSGATFTYTVSYANLTSAPSFSHIHAPALVGANAGIRVNFNVGSPTSATGSFTGTFNVTDIVAPPITADSLAVLMTTGYAYVNIHTPANPGGEIRGQLAKLP